MIKQIEHITPLPKKGGWITWRKVLQDMIITCCDCGLEHRFQYRTNKDKLEWRAKRNK